MADARLPCINKVIIDGRLGRDPDLTYTQAGMAICKFGLAHDEHRKGGEKKTVWLNVVLFAKAAEYAAGALHKGDMVMIEGSLSESEWTDKTSGEGKKRLEILGSRAMPLSWPADGAKPTTPAAQKPQGDYTGEDEELPF